MHSVYLYLVDYSFTLRKGKIILLVELQSCSFIGNYRSTPHLLKTHPAKWDGI